MGGQFYSLSDFIIVALFPTSDSIQLLFGLVERIQMAARNGVRALPQCRITSNLDAVGLDFVVEGLAADAEAFGGFELVPAGFLEGLDDGVAFNPFQQGETRVVAFVRSAFGVGDGKISHVHFVAFVQEDGTLDFILQLSNVARPVKCGEPLNRCRREARNDVIGLRGEPFQK